MFLSSTKLKFTLAVTSLVCSLNVLAATPPKLILVMVIDGLPQEQVVRYRHQFSEGGFNRMMNQGSWYSQAHQAHGITVTAIGHAAVLTGAYPYQHGIIANTWTDPSTLEATYCAGDTRYHYIGESTEKLDGTSPANLRVSTLGDELKYATGNRARVLTVSGKDRGAILLAGKMGTAYMYMEKSGRFASSTYYMEDHPQWVKNFNGENPSKRFYGQTWSPILSPESYQDDAKDSIVAYEDSRIKKLPHKYDSKSGEADKDFHKDLRVGPFVDQLTMEFAQAAIDAENLGNNPTGATDLLGISFSSHDAINHTFGPESKFSHDHLQHLDRIIAKLFDHIDKKVGLNNVLVVLTADHGFPNVKAFSNQQKLQVGSVGTKELQADLNKHLEKKFGYGNLISHYSYPGYLINRKVIQEENLNYDAIEAASRQFILAREGVAQVYTRSQLERGSVSMTRQGLLMQRAFNQHLSPDLFIIPKPQWILGGGKYGTSHGTPHAYDTNVPLLWMGPTWIKRGQQHVGAEVVDIAPTLASILNIRPPSGSEGRVLAEIIKQD